MANKTVGNLATVLEIPKQKQSRKARARVRGQGTMFLRGATYWMELHWNGQRFRKSLDTTDRETALVKLDNEVAAIRSGVMPKHFDPITVSQMYDAWMKSVELGCKPRTVQDYKSRWEVHLKTAFGKLLATQVTLDEVTAYLLTRKKQGAGTCTRNRENRVLQMIFGFNIDKIPADRFPIFPKMESERALVRKGRLSNEDYKVLRQRLDEPKVFWLKVFLTMTFKFGFRKTELLNAKVSYFNPKASTFVLPSYSTKNKAERVVDLAPDGEIYKLLVALADGRPADAPLFHRNGKPIRDLRGAWAKATEGMRGGSGVDGTVTIHDLRRSAITNMSEKGVTSVQAGTHMTADVFNRYISRDQQERQKTAKLIEGD